MHEDRLAAGGIAGLSGEVLPTRFLAPYHTAAAALPRDSLCGSSLGSESFPRPPGIAVRQPFLIREAGPNYCALKKAGSDIFGSRAE